MDIFWSMLYKYVNDIEKVQIWRSGWKISKQVAWEEQSLLSFNSFEQTNV